MAYTDFLTPVRAGDDEFAKFAKTQAQLHLACVNAGITIDPVANPLLTDIVAGDGDLQKWQKLNAWAANIAGGVSTAVGGAQSGNPAVTTGTSNLAIAFAKTFTSAPSVVCNLVPAGGGNPILVDPTLITTTGFTAQWGFAIPAGYTLTWQAVPKTQ